MCSLRCTPNCFSGHVKIIKFLFCLNEYVSKYGLDFFSTRMSGLKHCLKLWPRITQVGVLWAHSTLFPFFYKYFLFLFLCPKTFYSTFQKSVN